ncbi:MAG TPA: response regulator [Xanthomonadales bacterium]|nr:response regulator [Xanthomonadales bacterium]
MSGQKVLNILVAEDNLVNQVVLRKMLEHAGHRVDAVSNGRQAIKALAKLQYDLLIMDCLMPVMDGFEAARTIRSSTYPAVNCAIPILAITAMSTAEDRWRCLDAGMNGHISKPVMAGELYAWLANHLGTARRSVTLRRPRKRIPEGLNTNPDLGHRTARQSELILKMTPVLLRDARQWRQELKDHLEAGKFEALGLLAHKIRGTADVLGYPDLSTIAAQLEKSAKAGDAGEAAILVSQLLEALLQLIENIEPGP